MPRRPQPIIYANAAIPNTDPVTSSPPHPTVLQLRRSWKFAAICQFLFVFDEAFGMSGFETESLERDFAGTESDVIPDLMKRLLYTLTLDRRIDLSNWQDHLRRQYLARDPNANPFGTVEEPRGWDRLSLDDKISSLHYLCEWQLQDPERFRKLVKSEEDTTTWRVAPIGWDAEDNVYWLFDDNRIWIQRPAPLPQPPAKKGSKRARMEAAAARRAAAVAGSAKSTPAKANAKKADAESAPASTSRSSPRKRGRASEIDSDGAAATPTKRGRGENGKVLAKQPPRRGTRSSARFAKDGEEGSESDLSDPPEDDEAVNKEAVQAADEPSSGIEAPGEDDAAVVKDEEEAESAPTKDQTVGAEADENDWVEFEAIVINRADWLEFAARFTKSKDLNERNLHAFVNNDILPTVLAAFDEQDRQRAMEAAMANRKRSSRIAMKESEKEERERDREARVRMEEKMARLRQEEEQERAREEEEAKAQKAREDRMREREERILARERETEEKALREEMERERREREREERKRRRDEIIANGGVPPSEEATATPEPMQVDDAIAAPYAVRAEAANDEDDDENWELNCEVCGKAGINPPDEGTEIVCCEACGVWQHVKCWNKFDKHVLGRKRNRDWAGEDFYCTKCRPPAEGVPTPMPGMVFKRERSSPSGGGIGRSSQDPETPTRTNKRSIGGSTAAAADETLVASPTRPKIKLVHKGAAADTVDFGASDVKIAAEAATDAASVGSGTAAPADAAPATPGTIEPKQEEQAAKTDLLTSLGASLNRPIAAPSAIPVEPSRLPSAQPLASSTTVKPTEGKSIAAVPEVGSPAPAPLTRTASATAPATPGSMPPPATIRTSSSSAQRPVAGSRSPANGQDNASGGGGGSACPSPETSDAKQSSPRPAGTAGVSSRPASLGGFSAAAATSPKYARSVQPVGSFPIRHQPARSPLSRPYDSALFQDGDSDGGLSALPSNGGFSLGPSRASSPTSGYGNPNVDDAVTPSKLGGLQSGILLRAGKPNSPFGSAASSPSTLPTIARPANGGDAASSPPLNSPMAKGTVTGAISSVPLFSPATTTSAPIGDSGDAGPSQQLASSNAGTTAGTTVFTTPSHGNGNGNGKMAPPGTPTPSKQFGPSPHKNPFGSPFCKVAPPTTGAAAKAFKVLEAGEKNPPPSSSIGLGRAVQDASTAKDVGATGSGDAAAAAAATNLTVLPDAVLPALQPEEQSDPPRAVAAGEELLAISTPATEKASAEAVQAEGVAPESSQAPAPTPQVEDPASAAPQ
ncbi:hypothetical protein ACQY0O_005389 [Thecaphora frezii]